MMKGSGRCGVHTVAWILVIVGGLNWGLIGVAQLNLVNLILGGVPALERIVYVLVGLSAVATLFESKCCMPGSHKMMDAAKPPMGSAPQGGGMMQK